MTTSVVVGGVTTVTTPSTQFVGQDIQIASATGTVGFFGVTPVVQPTSASVTDYASLKVALQALGLIGV